jgi:hypothetical protein
VVLLVALAGPLSDWISQWVPQPWAALAVIVLGAVAKAVQVLWPVPPSSPVAPRASGVMTMDEYKALFKRRSPWARLLLG